VKVVKQTSCRVLVVVAVVVVVLVFVVLLVWVRAGFHLNLVKEEKEGSAMWRCGDVEIGDVV
jgi:hypothetical protein